MGARLPAASAAYSQEHHKRRRRCSLAERCRQPGAPPIAAGPERSGGTPAIREGGARAGEAEHAFGVGIKTSKTPSSAKASTATATA